MRPVVNILAFALFATPIARAVSDKDDAIAKADQAPTAASKLADDFGKERCPLTLPQAIRIALDNCEFARVLSARMPDGTVTELNRRDPGAFLDYQPYFERPLGFSDNPPRKARIAGPLMIQRVKAHTPHWKFRADAMALVRSVEQQYWVVAARGYGSRAQNRPSRQPQAPSRRKRATYTAATRLISLTPRRSEISSRRI